MLDRHACLPVGCRSVTAVAFAATAFLAAAAEPDTSPIGLRAETAARAHVPFASTFALKPWGIETDDLGNRHVRLAAGYRGLPVIGADIVVHLPAHGGEVTFTGRSPDLADLALTPAISRADALRRAGGMVGAEAQASMREATLVVDARASRGRPRLAWQVGERPARVGAPGGARRC